MNTYHCCSYSLWVSTRPIILAGVLILLVSCGGGENGQDPDPGVQDFPVAYVDRPLPTDNQGNLIQLDAREPSSFNPGAVLYIKARATVSSPAKDISSNIRDPLDPLTDNTAQERDIKDLAFNYDGTKLMFAMRFEDLDLNDGITPTWNIYEYDVQSGATPQLVLSAEPFNEGDDIAPQYFPGLPEGKIVFSSNRQYRSKIVLLEEAKTNLIAKQQFSAMDEDDGEPSFVLHVFDPVADEKIKQITYNQSHDLDPSFLSNGKILFSRWDNMGPRQNAMRLYTVNPDGSGLQQLYGTQSSLTGTNGSAVQFTKPQEMQDGRVMVILRQFTNTFEGGDIVSIDVNNFVDNTQPITAGVTGVAQSSFTSGTVNTQPGVSPSGRFVSAHPLQDGTNRALVSWSQCFLLDQQDVLDPDDDITLFCTPENLANPILIEAPPRYGVFLLDVDKQTQLPIVVPVAGRMFTHVAAAQDRIPPAVIQDVVIEDAADQTGILNIKSVYDFDGVFNDLDNGNTASSISQMRDPAFVNPGDWQARFLRVVKAVSLPDDTIKDIDNDAFGVGERVMREIVGYVPIEPDGSVIATVPANVALSISVLDVNGRRISNRHENWIHVRPGETLECNGCHVRGSSGTHGRRDVEMAANNPLNSGAVGDGALFFTNMLTIEPVTMLAYIINANDTMAEVHVRSNPNAIIPALDIVYQDVWTDDQGTGLTAASDIDYLYANIQTPLKPVHTDCTDNWSQYCRAVIHYEQHIHPLWSLPRALEDVNMTDRTCIICHNAAEVALGNVQLDLDTMMASDAYNNLMQFMSAGSASNSGVFFDRFADSNDVNHFDPDANMGAGQGILSPAELKLLSEWSDIGAQRYNNPFHPLVPVN